MSEYENPSLTWGVLVVPFWGCVPSPEREAAIAMADTVIGGAPFQVKSLVEIAFFLGGADATTLRWETWQTMWGQITETIEVDEVEVEVFPCLQEWIFTLADAFEEGIIVRRPSQKCQQLDFYNLP